MTLLNWIPKLGATETSSSAKDADASDGSVESRSESTIGSGIGSRVGIGVEIGDVGARNVELLLLLLLLLLLGCVNDSDDGGALYDSFFFPVTFGVQANLGGDGGVGDT
jgi:hypothetical protein